MLEIAREIAVHRRIDLPGLPGPMPPGRYRLVYRVEMDPIDERQIYNNGGEAIRIEDDQRYPLCDRQVEALLQSPHVAIAELVHEEIKRAQETAA